MPDIGATIGILNKFIDLGKELAKLPAMVLPQYQPFTKDMYKICQRILKSNENLMRWFNKFLYFDFLAANARGDFLQAKQEYDSMKIGPEFHQLKFSCHDIGNIYYQNIASKLGTWFADQRKLEEAEGIFQRLTDADSSMVDFITNEFINRLDQFITKAEQFIDVDDLNGAERQRLEFKRESAQIVQMIASMNNGLSELVMSFADIARIPITLE